MLYREPLAVAVASVRNTRMFVAFDVPEEVSSSIIGSLEGIEEHNARVVRKDDMHATLAFFGSMKTGQQDLLCGILESVELQRFRVVLSGFSLLGRGIVYARIVDGAKEMNELSSTIKSASRNAGIDTDMRDFFPHVTVARVRNWREGSMRKFIEGIRDVGQWNFTCTRISAKKTDFTDNGVVHTLVCSKELI